MTKTYDPHVGEAAWLYARAGWPVLPLHDVTTGYCSCADGPTCRVTGKHPRLRAAYDSATVDTRQIEQWWSRWPQANIGIRTGGPQGLIAVDLDGPAGLGNWERLVAEHGAVPDTATALTPHGRHL
jgi:hypothetical protein